MNKKKKLPIFSGASPEQVASDLQDLVDFQDKGLPLKGISQLIENKLVPHLMRYDLPAFHSLYNLFPEKGAEFGAKIALHYNQGVTNWQVSPGGVILEELCCRALCRLFELSPEAEATFMYCGTYANQQALYMALHKKAEQRGFDLAEKGIKGFKDAGKLAVLTSIDAHFSLKHAVRTLGLGEESLIYIPVDKDRRMDINALKNIVTELKGDKDIFCITATAGTTSTGSVDPILPVVEICEKIKAWSHVDGAYGLAFSLLKERRRLFTGKEQADSITWDPHKQFGVPIPSSMLFVRNRKEFERMAIYGEYFNRKDDPEPNPGLKSPPSTRPLSALPLVTSIRFQGKTKVLNRLRAPLNAIESSASDLKDAVDIELCHRPDTGILCLRLNPKGFPAKHLNNLQKFIYERIKSEGKRSISLTQLGAKMVLRLVAISPAVTSDSLLKTISYAREIARSAISSGHLF